jgi:hypothetical protein
VGIDRIVSSNGIVDIAFECCTHGKDERVQTGAGK